MSNISERADRFVRSVFTKSGQKAAPADPKKSAEVKAQHNRLMDARDRAVKSRKGF